MAGDLLSLAEKWVIQSFKHMHVQPWARPPLCRDKSFWIFSLVGGWQIFFFFFCKSKIVNVLGLAGDLVSVAMV